MKALELRDIKENVFLTLLEVLAPLPIRALNSKWDVSDFVDSEGIEWFETGYGGDEGISSLVNTRQRVGGRELQLLASSSSQIIWATFQGYDSDEDAEPWIRLHAIDSTYWRCETRDIATRQALMTGFQDVRLSNR